MPKNVLISFDDSENAMRAVNFVASHFKPEATITLFSVLLDTEAMCDMNSPELTPYFKSEQQSFCSLEDKKNQLIEKAAQTARNSLIAAGFHSEKVHIKTQKRSKGVARDIIQEADSGYDVVVIGKRGVSALKDFFLGNVSQKVLQGVKTASVLAVS
jgi:nucleotide-binding universal stress UspA family protein